MGVGIPHRRNIVKTPIRTVRIPDPLWNGLRDESRAIGSDASAIIRDLVAGWLEDQNVQPNPLPSRTTED